MQTFPKQKRTSFVRRHAVSCVSLAVVLAGGVGFAATGGTQVVKHWIVKLELVSANGQFLEARLEPVDGVNPETRTYEAELLVELQATTDTETDQDGASITAEATANKEFVPLRLANQLDPVFAQIDEAVTIVDWTDDAGAWQELHVVPVYADEQGFDVFTTFYGEDDETFYRQVGSVRGVDPDTTEVGQLVWPEATLAIIPFIEADGTERPLAIELTGRHAHGDPSLLHFRGEDGRDRLLRLERMDVGQRDEQAEYRDPERR